MSTRVAVVGTGLMGASVGLGARAAGLEVRGWDSDPANLAAAAERGAVDVHGKNRVGHDQPSSVGRRRCQRRFDRTDIAVWIYVYAGSR